MVAYLLGEMSDDEQTLFETRYLADDALFDQMLLVKKDVIDAYVRHHLDAETSDRFERHFLASPEGQKEVAFARALRQKLNEPPPAPAAKAQPSRWSIWIGSWSGREIGLAAAALLLLIIVGGWLLRENRKLHRELSALRAERANQLRHEEELQQRLAQLLAPPQTPAPINPTPERPAQTDDVVTINLVPDTARNNTDIQVVNLSAAARRPLLNLKLNFEPVALRCRVTLQGPDGARAERRSLRAHQHPQGGFSAQADFTTTQLKAGTYEVTVAGRDVDNDQEVRVPYRFRVELAGRR